MRKINMKDKDDFTGCEIGCFLISFLIWLCFWSAVVFIGIHFIRRYW